MIGVVVIFSMISRLFRRVAGDRAPVIPGQTSATAHPRGLDTSSQGIDTVASLKNLSDLEPDSASGVVDFAT